jgi:hypothetical protein
MQVAKAAARGAGRLWEIARRIVSESFRHWRGANSQTAVDCGRYADKKPEADLILSVVETIRRCAIFSGKFRF